MPLLNYSGIKNLCPVLLYNILLIKFQFFYIIFRVKNGYEEANVQLDDVRRENKSLSDEIKDLMEQISEGGRSIHEIEKQRKKLEQEKFELETALGDAESALEQEENKLLRLSLEVNQVRADIGKP